MMPVGPLMIEHRLIEKIIKVMQQKVDALAPNKTLERTFARLHALTGCISCPPLSAVLKGQNVQKGDQDEKRAGGT